MSLADPTDPKPALEALLRWYIDMGVDAAIDEAPHDRFVAPPRTEAQVAPPADIPRPAPAVPSARPPTKTFDGTPVPADALVRLAADLAAGADTLDELRTRWEAVPGCGLAAAARMIFSGGTPGASIMLVGAAPEADDERAGEAFAGTHGRLLDAMLRAIGLDRSTVYLANVIPWRPPGGRAPTPLEVSLCLPFARRQIALSAPRLLLCLGERAGQPLLGTRDPLSRLRGRWLSHEGDAATVKTLVTFSLDYLLKQPLQKRRAWADLQMLQAAAKAEGLGPPDER